MVMRHMFHILQHIFSILSCFSVLVCMTSFGDNAESLHLSHVDCEGGPVEWPPGSMERNPGYVDEAVLQPATFTHGCTGGQTHYPLTCRLKASLVWLILLFLSNPQLVTHLGWHFSVFKAFFLFSPLISIPLNITSRHCLSILLYILCILA